MLQLKMYVARHMKKQQLRRACRLEAFEERRLLSVSSGPGSSSEGLPTISARVDGANEIFTITSDRNFDADDPHDYTLFWRTSYGNGSGVGGTAFAGTDYTFKQGEINIPWSGPGNPHVTMPSVVQDVTVPLIPNSARDGKTFTLYVFEDMDQNHDTDLARFNNDPPSGEPAGDFDDDFDAENQLTVTISAPKVDLNGPTAAGTGFTATWKNNGAVSITDSTAATVMDDDSTNLTSMTATIATPSTGDQLTCVTTGTSISSAFANGALTLSGSDTLAHYQQVLRTIKYNNTNDGPPADVGTVTVDFVANDGALKSTVATSTITIQPPKISIAGAMATEPPKGGAPVPMQFQVTLDRASSSPVTVHYETEDGSAVADEDYTSRSDDLIIPAHQTSAIFTVQILADTEEDPQPEPDKTFVVQLSNPNPSNIPITTSSATGTIQDAESDSDSDPNGDDGDDCGCGSESSNLGSDTGGTDGASPETGDVSMNQPLIAGPLTSNATEDYESGDNPHPIVGVNEAIPQLSGANAGKLAYSADVTLTFGGIALPKQYYSKSTGLTQGTLLRFAQEVGDADTLVTGTYLWSMTVNYHFDGGFTDTVTYRGEQSVVNRINSPYGNRWWISGLDQLTVQPGSATQPAGVTFVSGGGQAAFFAQGPGNTFTTPHGYYTTLVHNVDGTYTLTDPQRNQKLFSAAGQLQTETDPDGNVAHYHYGASGVESIDDAYGQSISFGYTGGKLSSATDTLGHITNVVIDSNGTLTSVVTPPPATGIAPVTTSMTYDPTSKLISGVTQASAATTIQTSYHFNSTTAKLDYVRHGSDNSTYSIIPAVVSGLLDPSSGLGTSSVSPAPFVTDTNRTATITDELGRTSTEIVNSHGLVLSEKDFNGNTTTYTRDGNGRILTMTVPRPDGPTQGPVPATTNTYDVRGNLKSVVYPDQTSESWNYDPTFNVANDHVDRLQHETVYGIDQTTGDVLSVHDVGTGPTDPTDRLTTYTYTPKPTHTGDLPGGLILTEVDPLLNETDYDYVRTLGHSFGKVSSTTYAVGRGDQATVHDEYDAAGNQSATVDGLGRRTTDLYDAQNQVTQSTLPGAVTSFQSATTVVAGIAPNAIAAADVDGDGIPDMIVANEADDSVGVFLGNGNGAFGPQTTFYAGPTPVAIAVGDFNHDGKIDLAVGDINDHTVSILLGDGHGAFQYSTSRSFTVGSDPVSIAVADVDGDNHLDVIVANSHDSNVSVLLGNGDGSFKPQATFGAGTGPSSVAVADLNGDHKLDLVIANFNGGNLSVLLGNGNGTFQNQSTVAVGSQPSSVAIGDLNGDGKPDLVVANSANNNVGVLLGNGTGAFGGQVTYSAGDTPMAIVLADMNNDASLDVVVVNSGGISNNVGLLLGNGDGTLTSQKTFATGTNPVAAAAADFNADGKPDLVVANAGDSVDSGGDSDVSILLGKGSTQTSMYDGTGRVLTQLDAFGNETQYVYDANGRLYQTIQPDPNGGSITTTNHYDSKGNLTSVTDPMGRTTHYDYDRMGNLIQVTAPNPDINSTAPGPITKYTYDANGDQDSMTDPLGHVTRYIYNSVHQLLETDLPNPDPNGTAPGPKSTTTYTPDGQVDTVTDANLHPTQYKYDKLGRVIKTIFAAADGTISGSSPYTQTHYDKNGNVDYTIDANFNETDYQYDFRNRQDLVTLPADTTGHRPTTATHYDSAGQVISVTDPMLRVTTYKYDGAGRPISTTVTSADGNTSATTHTTYDANGNVLTQQDADLNTTTYAYDSLNRQTDVYQPINGSSVPHTITTYWADGQVKTITNQVTQTTHYFYDGMGRQNEVVSPTPTGGSAPTITSTYDADSNLKTQTDALSETTIYKYDNLNRLTSVRQPNGDTTTYTYDAVGNRTSVTDSASTSLLEPQTVSAAGAYPLSMAVADMNGDGKPDLIVTHLADFTVGIRYGNGDGTFGAETTTLTTGQGPYSVAVADLDGDGRNDLVVTNYFDGTVSVFLQNTDGTFKPAVAYQTGVLPFSVTVADLDNNGLPDLIVADSYDNTISVLLGYGSGQFAARTTYSVGTKPEFIAAADLNHDGYLDLVVSNNSSNNVSVLLNNGPADNAADAGTFQSSTPLVTGNAPGQVALADLDGDGNPDLIVADTADSNVDVILGNSNGTFQSQQHTFATGASPYAMAVADLNSDGKLDVVTGNATSNTISVLLGNGNGGFSAQTVAATGNVPIAVAVSDVNRDGTPDVVVSNLGANSVSVLANDGSGMFRPQNIIASGATPLSLTMADVNSDGKPDLIVANTFMGTVTIELSNGDGTFQTLTPLAVGVLPFSVAAADLDGDGHLDLILTDAVTDNSLFGSLTVLWGIGNGTFESIPKVLPVGALAYSTTVADVNGDGMPDLITTNTSGDTLGSNGTVSVILNNGGRTFIVKPNCPVGAKPEFVAVGDLNHDGNPDLVVSNNSDNNVSILLGDGQGNFTAHGIKATGQLPSQLALADLNGDGKLDLIVANAGDNNIGVLLGNGDGSFANQTTYGTGLFPYAIALADVNADDKPDLLVTDANGNTASVLLGNGQGAFGVPTNWATGTTPSSVAVADITGDGKPDVIVANFGSNSVSLILAGGNVTRYAYDTRNRVQTETNQLGQVRTYGYDANGNMTSEIDRDHQKRVFDFDHLNREIDEKWLIDASQPVTEANTKYTDSMTYYADGELLSNVDNNSSYTYGYDGLGRLDSTDNNGTPNMPHVVLSGTNDSNGNRLSLSATIGSAADFQNTYAYDANNREMSVIQTSQPGQSNVAAKEASFDYRADGTLFHVHRSFNPGITTMNTTIYGYDADGRLTSMTSGIGGVANFSWQYNAANRITSSVSLDGTQNYTYDPSGQLLSDDLTNEQYAYDGNGNRLTSAANGNQSTYSVGADNRMLFDGTNYYAYDGEGNETLQYDASGHARVMTYDDRNRLTELVDYTGATVTNGVFVTGTTVVQDIKYTYDVNNLRIAKSVSTSGGAAAVTGYVYDGANVALEFDPGVSSSSPQRYLYGPAVDQVLAVERVDDTGSTVLWTLTDNLGSVRELYNNQKQIVDHIVYNSFGVVTSESVLSTHFAFGYTGAMYDGETGLQYHDARYYDPFTARWISQDPVGLTPEETNLYRYVNNAPSMFVDPSGLSELVSVKLVDSGKIHDFDSLYEGDNPYVANSQNWVKITRQKADPRYLYLDGDMNKGGYFETEIPALDTYHFYQPPAPGTNWLVQSQFAVVWTVCETDGEPFSISLHETITSVKAGVTSTSTATPIPPGTIPPKAGTALTTASYGILRHPIGNGNKQIVITDAPAIWHDAPGHEFDSHDVLQRYTLSNTEGQEVGRFTVAFSQGRQEMPFGAYFQVTGSRE